MEPLASVLRPFQINFLFPVLCPHLFLSAIKISIIPYSFIIFRLFLNASKAHKSILYKCQVTCLDQCNCAFKVQFNNLKDGYKSLLQLKHDFYGGSKVDSAFKSLQSYNEIMEMNCQPACKFRTGNKEFIWSGLIIKMSCSYFC